MENLTVNRTAELIAAEINDIKDRTKRVVIYNSIEIGRRLTEAKELVPAGEWGKWLEESVDYKKSTANNLMRIFKEYGSSQLSLLGSNTEKEIYDKLDYSKAVILLGTTEEEKEKILTENDIEEMSSRELKKLRDKLKKEKKAREEAEKKVQDIQKENRKKIEEANKSIEDMIQSKQKEIDNANKIREKAMKYEENIKKLEEEIGTLTEEINELKERPVEVTGIDEGRVELEEKLKKVEQEKREEIEKLEREKLELEKKIKENSEVVQVDDAVSRYGIYFNEIVDKFDKLLGALEQIQNGLEKEQYKEATKQLLNMMEEKMQ